MNRKAANNFLAAFRFAAQTGQPLNLFVTLNMSHTVCTPSLASAAFERLRDNHFTRWLRYRDQLARKSGRPGLGPPTYAWVIEVKDGYTHIHWCVHVRTSHPA